MLKSGLTGIRRRTSG